MKPVAQSILEDFDAWAGATYGAWATSNLARSAETFTAQARLQLLIALRSLAMCSAQSQALNFARGQLSDLRQRAGIRITMTIPDVDCAWPVWPLLGASVATKADAADDNEAVALLLEAMWAKGKDLYDAKTLPAKIAERYASPDACVTVQLGIALRELITNDSARAGTYEAWRVALLNAVLPAFPGRVMRGFAPNSPLFEDVVLAFLHVAQWMTRPELPWIASYVNACHHDRKERLTPYQLLFGGLLLGRLRGYSRMGGLVTEPETRASLSRLGAAIAASQAGHVEDSLRWLTPNGELSELTVPFVRPVSIQQEQRLTLHSHFGDTDPPRTDTHSEVINERLTVVIDNTITLVLVSPDLQNKSTQQALDNA